MTTHTAPNRRAGRALDEYEQSRRLEERLRRLELGYDEERVRRARIGARLAELEAQLAEAGIVSDPIENTALPWVTD